MKFFKRPPREFTVRIGEQWTINGEPTENTTPSDVLREIYDIAVYFPITITVVNSFNNDSYVLEMDEEGNTTHRPQEGTDETEPDSAPQSNESEVPVAELLDEETPVESQELVGPIKTEDDSTTTTHIGQALTGKRTLGLVGAGLGALALIGLFLNQVLGIGASSDDAQASDSTNGTLEYGPSWQTPLPESTPAEQAIDDDFGNQLWSIEPGEIDTVSWFAAGIVVTDGDEVRMYAHLTGEEAAAHAVEEDIDLETDLAWATEFYHDGEPAVGLRIADTFVALTTNGDHQIWEVPDGYDISVHGTTPMMTNASNTEEADDITYQALHIGEDEPVDLTINSAMATRAVDGDWIIQLEGNNPRAAMNPVDRSNDDTTAHAVTLTPPTEAEFIRHLDAGHGHSMALWQAEDEMYLGIHQLEGQSPGEATTFVPAPFSEEEATGWAIARGMDLTIIGPYAVDLTTGELAAYSETEFTRGYGPAAITTDDNEQRIFIIDNTEYTETNRIIGYTGRGTILVRLTDGSIAAYGEDGGTV